MASCRSTFIASYLHEKHHTEGVSTVLIHPPTSLEAVVANQVWPANKLGLIGLSILNKGNSFDTLSRIKRLTPSTGSLCVIVSEGDTTLPKDTDTQFQEAAKTAGCSLKMIREKAAQGNHNPHFREPLENPEVLIPYLQFLGAPVANLT
jgi:hypothetical protein